MSEIRALPKAPIVTAETPIADVMAYNQQCRDYVRAMVDDYAKSLLPKQDCTALLARPLRFDEMIRAQQAVQSYAAECAKLLTKLLLPEPIIIRADEIDGPKL